MYIHVHTRKDTVLFFLEQEINMQSLIVQDFRLQCLLLSQMNHLNIRRITVYNLVLTSTN